ncbi:TPA: hypothetical protein DDW35_09650 [Candidatus Sumerlaeota bacterium]|nr:hypothetical protein [Candidatus Sumerlaeota bacterium]
MFLRSFVIYLFLFSLAHAVMPSNPSLPPFEARPGASLDAYLAFGPLALGSDVLSTSSLSFVPPDTLSTFTLIWRDGVPQSWYVAPVEGKIGLNVLDVVGPGKVADSRIPDSNTKSAFLLSRRIKGKASDRVNVETSGARRVWINGQLVENANKMTLSEGLNDLVIESLAPTTATTWVINTWFGNDKQRPVDVPIKPAAPAPQPFVSGSSSVAWTLYLSSRAQDAKTTTPLLLLMPPPGEEMDCFNRRVGELVEEVRASGWAVAVPYLPLPPSPLRKTQPALTRKEALETVFHDLNERLPLDTQRVALCAFGFGAAEALDIAMESSGRYAGVALVDAPGGVFEAWSAIPPGTWWHPPVTRLEVGKAKAALEFFKAHPLNPAPVHGVIHSSGESSLTASWLRLVQPENPLEGSLLRAEVGKDNKIILITRNVGRFELALQRIPGLVAGKPIVLDINQTQQRIVGAKLPPSVTMHQSTNAAAWIIEETATASELEPYSTLTRFSAPMAAWSDSAHAGLNQLIARAARKATNATVAVLPVGMVRVPQGRGGVNALDVAHWTENVELTTCTVSRQTLRMALEADFSGPRRWITDGLDAVVENGIEDEVVLSTETLPTTATLSNALSTTTLVTTTTLSTATLSSSVSQEETTRTLQKLNEARLGVFQFTALDNLDPEVVIVVRKDMLTENWMTQNLTEKTLKMRAVLALITNKVSSNATTLRDALQEYFEKEPVVHPFAPDIRRVPFKKAEKMKGKPEKGDE